MIILIYNTLTVLYNDNHKNDKNKQTVNTKWNIKYSHNFRQNASVPVYRLQQLMLLASSYSLQRVWESCVAPNRQKSQQQMKNNN